MTGSYAGYTGLSSTFSVTTGSGNIYAELTPVTALTSSTISFTYTIQNLSQYYPVIGGGTYL